MLRECAEELVDVSVRQAATLNFDFDKHAVVVGADSQDHRRVSARELECVLKQIDDNRVQDLAIDVNDCSGFAGLQGSATAVCWVRRLGR